MKYVDLGLSVLWADCNIGANTPEEFGDYYKWDEIPKEYKIPTKEQQDELRNNCTWEWTTQNEVNGYKVTSNKNGNSIFLPAAGSRYNNTLINANCFGDYWSSSLLKGNSYHTYFLCFGQRNVSWSYGYYYYGQSVRPIKSKTNFKNKTTMTLKEVNEIFPLKSGMCLELIKGSTIERLILFQYGKGNLCYINFDRSCTWDILNRHTNYNYDKIRIYQSATKCVLFDTPDLIFNSDDYTIKELTLQEIADKFGVKVENLRIKD